MCVRAHVCLPSLSLSPRSERDSRDLVGGGVGGELSAETQRAIDQAIAETIPPTVPASFDNVVSADDGEGGEKGKGEELVPGDNVSVQSPHPLGGGEGEHEPGACLVCVCVSLCFSLSVCVVCCLRLSDMCTCVRCQGCVRVLCHLPPCSICGSEREQG